MSRQSEAKPEPNEPDATREITLVRLGSRAYLALAPDVDERAVRAVRQLAAWTRGSELEPSAKDPPPQSGERSSFGSH